eukprot:TRINITY_DN1379_c0_g1_i1.p1 TRINITY_DN1379_c0_g1~~TRINITY_DN1379_c0_g1_i1.p1  ORF type:complete len:527 (+),score=141.58 TRINITY_DN1379_c0_g1_i1:69-1583(+)
MSPISSLLVVACALLLMIACAQASSHSEAPGTAGIPASDVTDVYAFVSYEKGREGYGILAFNVYPLQYAGAGPNWFALNDKVMYEVYVDMDGDLEEDLTFQFYYGDKLGGVEVDGVHQGLTVEVNGQDVPVALKALGPISFEDQTALNFFQTYRLNVIEGNRNTGTVNSILNKNGGVAFEKPMDNIGEKTIPNYKGYANKHEYDFTWPTCDAKSSRMFVGQRNEPFSVNLGQIFDLVNMVPIESGSFPGGIEQDKKNNALRRTSVTSFVLEVPLDCLLAGNTAEDGIIGVWAGTRELIHDGDTHVAGDQISRLGNPLVNEVLIGLKDKNAYNLAEPKNDEDFKTYISTPSFPEILSILFKDAVNTELGTSFTTIAPTNFPRTDLELIFLEGIPGANQPTAGKCCGDMLRLNTNVPPTARADQNSLGYLAGDLAGYPNGRRPGDDVVDIVLRGAMGAVCHAGLGVCEPEDAPVGNVPFTDGAPTSATKFKHKFPWFNEPRPGGKL